MSLPSNCPSCSKDLYEFYIEKMNELATRKVGESFTVIAPCCGAELTFKRGHLFYEVCNEEGTCLEIGSK